MSVLKNKRKASQFEVFHHLYKMRRDITELLLRDFGYSYEKADKRLLKRFNGRGYADLTEAEQLQYDRLKQRWEAFDDWLTCMRRKMKKLVHILTEKEFDDWFNSWMCNHYRIMSKQQRENMNTLFAQLKKEVYHDVHNHPE